MFNHVDAKKTLDIFRLVCKGQTEPFEDLAKAFANETNDFRKMDLYSNLLQKSITSILKTEEEKDVQSLFRVGGTSVLSTHIKGIEDFKLISFLVIK
jgi:hypothetical protein